MAQEVIVYTPMQHFLWNNADPAVGIAVAIIAFFVILVGALLYDKVHNMARRKRRR